MVGNDGTANGAKLFPVLIQFGFVLVRPDRAQDVPTKCPVMPFVRVLPEVLQEVADGAVDITFDGEALLPVVFTVLFCTFFKVHGYFQQHI